MIPLGLVGLVIVLAAIGGGDEGEGGGSSSVAQDADSSAQDGDQAADAPAPIGVGDTDTTSGFEITLLTVEHPFQLAEFDSEPTAGSRLIGVELSARNLEDERRTLSSLLGLEIEDATGQRFNLTFRGFDRPSFDGEVQPGGLLRGWAVFEVPEDSTGLVLVVRGSVTAAGARFDLGLG